MSGVYLTKFGLREEPFRLTPDPKYFFYGQQYERVLAELRYGIEQKKGFMVLTGEVGTGKTTISRTLLDTLDPKFRTALVLNPSLTTEELLRTIVQDFGLRLPSLFPTKKEMVDTLNTFLLKVALEGGGALLIVDEAQNLTGELLEELRLLSNLETDQEKLLQILLIGQPELSEKLASKGLRQLRQRVTVWAKIGPLDRKETGAYVLRRLNVASGGLPGITFAPDAVRSIHRFGGGYPRTTNILCDRALMLAFLLEVDTVTSRMISRAAREVIHKETRAISSHGRKIMTAAAAVLTVALIPSGMGYLQKSSSTPDPVAARVSSGERKSPPQEVLSRYLTSQGYDYLGKEVLMWRLSGADIGDLQIALKLFDIGRQYNLNTALVPVDHSLWQEAGAMGIIPWDVPSGFALIEAGGVADGEWNLITGLGEEHGLRVPAADLKRVKEALVIFRPLRGLGGDLGKGSEGPEVFSLQTTLVSMGVLVRDGVDGIFGSRTAAALAVLQKKWGLDATGSYNDQTGYYLAKFNKTDRG